MTSSNFSATISKSIIALFVLTCMLPGLAMARFVLLGTEDTKVAGHTYITIPNGIDHELNPANWVSYRVRITHDDSIFPNIGWKSDEFTPSGSRIFVCNDSGCNVAEVDCGTEDLEWQNYSKLHVYLEAKSCALCGWDSYELSYASE